MGSYHWGHKSPIWFMAKVALLIIPRLRTTHELLCFSRVSGFRL